MKCGEIWRADFPYKEDPVNRKERPVVIVGWSPQGADQDSVVLVVSISSFGGGGGGARKGDIEIVDAVARGLRKDSWVRARRLWATDPHVFKDQRAAIAKLTDDELTSVLAEISGLFKPFR